MRTTRTEMIPTTITTYTCDFCNFTTENNRGCCGYSAVMSCTICDKDCCHNHRTILSEIPNEDYPSLVICPDCLPKAERAWNIATYIAGRHDDINDVFEQVYNNIDDYKDIFKEEQNEKS